MTALCFTGHLRILLSKTIRRLDMCACISRFDESDIKFAFEPAFVALDLSLSWRMYKFKSI